MPRRLSGTAARSRCEQGACVSTLILLATVGPAVPKETLSWTAEGAIATGTMVAGAVDTTGAAMTTAAATTTAAIASVAAAAAPAPAARELTGMLMQATGCGTFERPRLTEC